MKYSRYSLLVLACLALIAASPFPDLASQADILGQHVVQRGETLYCIGRGYGVLPGAIAQANALTGSSILSIGQVLNIPAAQWVNIPAGPVCAPQFQSPFTGLAPSSGSSPTSTPTTATPTPSATILPASGVATYTVRRGDNLFRIALRFGVTVANLKVANGLVSNLIFVGQVLIIPNGTSEGTGGGGVVITATQIPTPPNNCDPSYPTVCIPRYPPDLNCPEIQFRNFLVLPSDPHGFDGNDNDGIGCET